jgi:hypothetical protein
MSDYFPLQEFMVSDFHPEIFPRTTQFSFLRCREAFWEICATVFVFNKNVTRRDLIAALAVSGLLPRRDDNDKTVSLVCPYKCGFTVRSGRESH